MIKEALNKQILDSRALSYRKVVLGLAVALLALTCLPQAQFEEMSLFGVKLGANHEGNRSSVLRAVACLLAYHSFFFVYYAWIDLNNWLRLATEENSSQGYKAREFFPEWQMFFGYGPRTSQWQHQSNGELITNWSFDANADNGQATLRPSKQPPHNREWYFFVLNYKTIKLFRIRFIWFCVFDVLVPLILMLVGLGLWSYR